jgi:hypothetical protein
MISIKFTPLKYNSLFSTLNSLVGKSKVCSMRSMYLFISSIKMVKMLQDVKFAFNIGNSNERGEKPLGPSPLYTMILNE